MTLTAWERETVIRVGDDTDQVSIWTSQPKWYRSLKKRAKPTEIRKQDGREVAWRFFVPANWLPPSRVRPPKRVTMTAEAKAAGATRLAEGRARRKADLARKPIAAQ